MPTTKQPDIDHTGEPVGSPQEQAMRRHRPEYADMCPICAPKIERAKRISALYMSLKEFGYSTVTRDDVAIAYDGALKGEDTGADIIRKLVKSQMVEAGLINA